MNRGVHGWVFSASTEQLADPFNGGRRKRIPPRRRELLGRNRSLQTPQPPPDGTSDIDGIAFDHSYRNFPTSPPPPEVGELIDL